MTWRTKSVLKKNSGNFAAYSAISLIFRIRENVKFPFPQIIFTNISPVTDLKKSNSLPTFDHLSDLLLVQVVAFGVEESPEEVLEAVVDFCAWGQHRDPLTDGMSLHVLEVLDTLNHLQKQRYN